MPFPPEPPTTLLVAIGNPFRRDDGVAARLAELLEGRTGVYPCLQLPPEVADEMPKWARVIFADADLREGEVSLERVDTRVVKPSALGHALSIEEVTAMAERLFDFRGEAWVCRMPGGEFADGAGLSPLAEANAQRAAALLVERFSL